MKIKRPDSPLESFSLAFAERPFDVVGFGLNSVDHLCIVPQYPQPNSKTEILRYERLPGGQVATTAIFLARMGIRTKYIGKVGGDDAGRLSLQSLMAAPLDTSNVIVEENLRNRHAIIIIDKQFGERTILFQGDAELRFKEEELKREDLCAGRILHINGYDCESAIRAASWCQEEGIYVSADLDKVSGGCRDLIRKVDLLITGGDFPSEFTGLSDPVEALLELGKKFHGFLAVTMGSRGAMALVGNRCLTFPALRINAVDTTGAGDIFHGGFIYGLLQNWPLERIMAFANAAAGLSCGYLGARAGIRPLQEIMHFADELISSSAPTYVDCGTA